MNEYRSFGKGDFRSPEHWDDHGFDDDCPVQPHSPSRISVRGEWGADSRARQALKDFLQIAGATPLKRFGEGEEFVGSAYQDGTIIGFNSEALFPITDGGVRKFEYLKPHDFWGVLESYGKGEDVTRVLIWYPRSEEMTSARDIYPGLVRLPNLISGVTHLRTQENDRVVDKLRKISDMNLFAFGEAVTEKQTTGSRFGLLKRAFMPGNGVMPR